MALYGNLPARDLSNLRAVIFAGEVFPVKFLRQLMSVIPRARFWNWYGPTETNVCTSYEVKGLSQDSLSIPIGKACSEDEVFALAEDGKVIRVPGETGELYVRGPTVMQGYWNDPQKTQAVLVKSPIDSGSEEKICRTGDFVGLDPNGDYLYFGRKDGMVKTRGYRVELGEIEAALYSHPDINEAAVVPVKDELAGNLLHAFVSLHGGSTLTKDKILAYCATKLPKYMIPDTVAIEGALPKTSSGKTDRVALTAKLKGGLEG
jgi:acyl-coenzyme A synthetase/AMP-(fatty) acid ligase